MKSPVSRTLVTQCTYCSYRKPSSSTRFAWPISLWIMRCGVDRRSNKLKIKSYRSDPTFVLAYSLPLALPPRPHVPGCARHRTWAPPRRSWNHRRSEQRAVCRCLSPQVPHAVTSCTVACIHRIDCINGEKKLACTGLGVWRHLTLPLVTVLS
jgi:hypothetical protein